MSQSEFHKGELRKYPYDRSLSIKELEQFFINEGFEPNDDGLFYFKPNFDSKSLNELSFINNTELFYDHDTKEFWSLFKHQILEDRDRMEYHTNKEGGIEFSTSFNNGGSSIEKQIQSILNGESQY